MMQIKEKFKTLVLGAFVSVFTFFMLFMLLELFLRISKIQSDNFIKQDPVLGWNHLANKEGYSVGKDFKVKRRLNKDGFIGRDYSYTKQPDTYRIVIAGDSLTEGFQVNEADTYSALIESKINNAGLDKKVEVLNMGIAGYGTQRELYVFEKKGLRFNPDLLILAFFVGNDFTDNIGENINREARFTAFQEFKNDIKLFVRNHFSAWRFVLQQKSRNKFLNFLKNNNNSMIKSSTTTDPLFQKEYSEDTQKMINRSKELLLAFKKLADENKKDHLVLILPSAGQIYFEGDDNFYSEKINEVLKNYFKLQKIKYIDLLPEFKNYYKLKPKIPLYLPRDGHPSENGHLVIADKVVDYLKNLLNK